jgi:hypothetical protein
MTVDDVIPTLLEACPAARPAWDEHLSWWDGQPAGYYNDVSVFAHHVVNSYSASKFDEIPSFFAALERLIVEGNEEVVGLATVGLIEDVQNISSHQSFGYAVFEQWLQPESHREWLRIEAAWRGVGSLAEMIRKERG